jgi:hypothetical protein
MLRSDSFAEYGARLRRFIEGQEQETLQTRADSLARDDSAFNDLALSLFRLQFETVPPYRQLCKSLRREPGHVSHWKEIPAVPTSAFKDLDFTSLTSAERTTVFHSSGTTGQSPSRHFHDSGSLALYELSLSVWFRVHLLPDLTEGATTIAREASNSTLTPAQPEGCGRRPGSGTFQSSAEEYPASCAVPTVSAGMQTLRPERPEGIRFLFLTPRATAAPHSSLVHMFETIRRRYGLDDSWFVGGVDADGGWTLDLNRTLLALEDSCRRRRPLALLGTAFSFVHLLDRLEERHSRFALPCGSRAMETGGYKGRSRVLSQAELHGLIAERLGIRASHIVCEYGMSELGSQAYDRAIVDEAALPPGRALQETERCFRFPPWARVQIVSPETGLEVGVGSSGLIHVVDLANVRSVLAVETEDLGVRRETGFDLIGRPSRWQRRGCSLQTVP